MIDSLLIVQPQYHALFGIRFHAKFLGSCLNMEEEDSIDELIYKVCRLISYNVGKGNLDFHTVWGSKFDTGQEICLYKNPQF